MGFKNYKPTTPGRRVMSVLDFSEITTDRPERKLLDKHMQTGGRNAFGRITSRFRGGGVKRRYRIVDFRREKLAIPARVATIEYDPNRSARIALLHYADGEKRYIMAPVGIRVGQTILSSNDLIDLQPGNAMLLKNIPLGTEVHNIELSPQAGGKLVRSAGNAAQLVAREGEYAQLKMPSGEVRLVHVNCRATVGRVGNLDHSNISIGKAGRKRWKGRRPHNRGTSMNPVDHPHGGGEGKTSGGRHPVTPWGKGTKGTKTRNNRRTNRFIVQDRRAKRQRAA